MQEIDGYTIVDEIARGGMGVVYRARDGAGRDVALKLVSGDLSPRARERFLREGQVTAALHHSGIVRVYACGEVEQRPYLVYELVEGGTTLDDLLQEADAATKTKIVLEAARALGHAHAQGVVHRDVKPANLLVDTTGRVRVADFGLAIAEGDDRLTHTGEIVGTPSYMAPEQLAGAVGSETPATDVWALGVVLYEALTGTLPFTAPNLLELIAQVGRSDPQRPSALASGVTPAVEAVILRALHRAPADRYSDAAAFARALAAALQGRGAVPGGGGGAVLFAAGCLIALVSGLVWLEPQRPQSTPQSALEAPPPSEEPPAEPVVDPQPAPLRAQTPIEEARSLLARGDLQAALDRLQGQTDPEAGPLMVEALIGLGRTKDALLPLATLPASPTKTRLRGLSDLVNGDLDAAARLLTSRNDLRAVDIERDRLALDEEVNHLWIHKGRALAEAQGDAKRATISKAERLLKRALESFPNVGAGAQTLARRMQTSVAELAVTVATAFDDSEDFPDLDTLIERAIALCPRRKLSMNAARAWLCFFGGGRERDPKIRTLIPEDPGPYLDTLDPRLRAPAAGLWFLCGDTRHELWRRSRTGEAALDHDIPAGPAVTFRTKLVSALCRTYRWQTHESFVAGRRGEGRVHLKKALEFAQQLEVDSDPRDPERAEIALTYTLAGDLDRARAVTLGMSPGPMRSLLEAECLLMGGKIGSALVVLEAMGDSVEYVEILVARGHANLLANQPERAQADFQRAKALKGPELGVDWHRPEQIDHLLEGGWWPGAR